MAKGDDIQERLIDFAVGIVKLSSALPIKRIKRIRNLARDYQKKRDAGLGDSAAFNARMHRAGENHKLEHTHGQQPEEQPKVKLRNNVELTVDN